MGELQKNSEEYSQLVTSIGKLMESARSHVATVVNTVLVETYWHVGKYIVEFEQDGNNRAKYGDGLIKRLARDLSLRYGKGFNRNNLQYMRKFFIAFPKSTTLSCNLTWSHYFEILKADEPLEISFYAKECEKEHWSVRELKRQMKSMLFHRIALSTDKEGVLALAQHGVEIQKPSDIVRDPVVLDFLGLPQERYTEQDLEKAIIDNMQMFLLELGKGFAFVGRQYRFMLGGRTFRVDLVFYHCILKTYVLIDLKRGVVKHEDVGQMNFYLNYFKNEVCTEGDAEPIGIVLGAYNDELTVEYAMQGITNQLFVSKYQLYIPAKETLQQRLSALLERNAPKEANLQDIETTK